jgi:hypothetical protein
VCRKLGTKPRCELCQGVGVILVTADRASGEDATRYWDDDEREGGYALVAGAFDGESE